MAEQEQNVNANIVWETGDNLDETNLATVNARNNSANYVERGLTISPDFAANTTDIGDTGARANYAVVENDSLAYDVLPDQATDIPFANNASVNHVYLAYDRSANQARYHLDDDDTAPTDPSLKIGTIDAPNNDSSTTNRDPDINAEEVDITGETFVRATRGSDTSSTTAGTRVNLYDGESADVRGEFNASAQFNPDESGEYVVNAGYDIRGSTAKGDSIAIRVFNVTDTVNVTPEHFFQAPRADTIGRATFVVELDSAKTYEIQATNEDSSFVVKGTANTKGVIFRSVVHG